MWKDNNFYITGDNTDKQKDNKNINIDHNRGYARKIFLSPRIIFLRLFGQKYAYSQIFVFDPTLPVTIYTKNMFE